MTITVKNLRRTFNSHTRSEGFGAAIRSLFKREYVVKEAVKDISFTIKPGELVGFIGPNGAGKSTTIKALTGVLHPTSGSVDILGYTPWTQRIEYSKHIGVVFGQKSQLWWDLPPLDAFHLSKGIYEIPEKEFTTRLHTMIRILRAEEIVQRPTRDLSLGERMKCEFIMAFLHNPRVLFLDEPTIGLDAVAKEEIREFLAQINRKNKTTVILTTHDMDDIEQICKRIIVIDKGTIIYDGSLDILKKKYVRSKVIEVDFRSVKNKRLFNRVKKQGVCEKERKFFLSLRCNKDMVNVPAVVSDLMHALDVVDILVHEPRLEEVIKEIYLQE